jgi:hypothetical protein
VLKKRGLLLGSGLVTVALCAALLVVVTGAFAGAGSPADKVVAGGDKTVVMAPQTGATLLTATMSTSKPTDLILSVTSECSILTTVDNVGSSTATAFGQVRIWVEVDGQIVPVQSISNPPQATPAGGDDTDKAVFCERTHTVTFMPTTQTDTISQYQATKSANAFNWLRQNVGAGSHTITVKADLASSATNGTAEAIVGNRTLVVEPTKMANDAIISSTASG